MDSKSESRETEPVQDLQKGMGRKVVERPRPASPTKSPAFQGSRAQSHDEIQRCGAVNMHAFIRSIRNADGHPDYPEIELR